MTRSRQYSRLLRRTCTTFIIAVIGAAGAGGAGCYDADPRSVRGALDALARAAESSDGRALFHVLDERSRSALASVVKDRQRAARLVGVDYPAAERAAAMRELGDAAEVGDPAELFARRCPSACIAALTTKLGAPVSQTAVGAELLVRTSQGGELRLFHGKDGWWGLVWRTKELAEERTRAARELVQIKVNADVYRRRRALEAQRSPR